MCKCIRRLHSTFNSSRNSAQFARLKRTHPFPLAYRRLGELCLHPRELKRNIPSTSFRASSAVSSLPGTPAQQELKSPFNELCFAIYSCTILHYGSCRGTEQEQEREKEEMIIALNSNIQRKLCSTDSILEPSAGLSTAYARY